VRVSNQARSNSLKQVSIGQFKPAEIVLSDSDGKSNLQKSHHKLATTPTLSPKYLTSGTFKSPSTRQVQSSIALSSTVQHQTGPQLSINRRPGNTLAVDKKLKLGISDLPVHRKPAIMINTPGGLSMKRPAVSQINSQIRIKRPKIVGGFIDDSDDSDDSDQESEPRIEVQGSAKKYATKHDHEDNEIVTWNSMPASPLRDEVPSDSHGAVLSPEPKPEPMKQLPLAHCMPFVGSKLKSTKPVSRSRVLELLGKKNSLKNQANTTSLTTSRQSYRTGQNSSHASSNDLERGASSGQLGLVRNAHQSSNLQSMAKAAYGIQQSCSAYATGITPRQKKPTPMLDTLTGATAGTTKPNHSISEAVCGVIISSKKVGSHHASSSQSIPITNGDGASSPTAEATKSHHNNKKRSQLQNPNSNAQARPVQRIQIGQATTTSRKQATAARQIPATPKDNHPGISKLGNKQMLSKSTHSQSNTRSSPVEVQIPGKSLPKPQSLRSVPMIQDIEAERITRESFMWMYLLTL
jgi:hypothetical protein